MSSAMKGAGDNLRAFVVEDVTMRSHGFDSEEEAESWNNEQGGDHYVVVKQEDLAIFSEPTLARIFSNVMLDVLARGFSSPVIRDLEQPLRRFVSSEVAVARAWKALHGDLSLEEGDVVIIIPGQEAAMAKAEAKKAKKAAKPEKTITCGGRIRELICQGKDTQTILDIIHKEFPESTAKSSDVSWNRGKLRKDGVSFPEAPRRSLAKAEAPAKKAGAKKAKTGESKKK